MTLIEIIIYVVLVSFIAIVTYSLLKHNTSLKTFMDKTGDNYLIGPSIIGLMKRDYAQLYSPHILPSQFQREQLEIPESSNPNEVSGTLKLEEKKFPKFGEGENGSHGAIKKGADPLGCRRFSFADVIFPHFFALQRFPSINSHHVA